MGDIETHVENGLKHLRALEAKRGHNYVGCRCGGIVMIPEGVEYGEDVGDRGICMDCDKPIAQKAYEAFALSRQPTSDD